MNVAAILVAAGRGNRMGGSTPKALLPVAGRPLFTHSLRTIWALPPVHSVILVVGKDWRERAQAIVGGLGDVGAPVLVVDGGAERQDSVAAGLARVEGAELVAVHDAARPFASADLFTACFDAAADCGAAIAAMPAHDTVKRANPDETIRETIDRATIWLAQTPQVFRTELLRRAYEKAATDGFTGTDEAALVERLSAPVRLIRGEATNRKLTTPDDLEWAERHASLGF